jgi:hypothetical protein
MLRDGMLRDEMLRDEMLRDEIRGEIPGKRGNAINLRGKPF